jgi:hypothetical protein
VGKDVVVVNIEHLNIDIGFRKYESRGMPSAVRFINMTGCNDMSASIEFTYCPEFRRLFE